MFHHQDLRTKDSCENQVRRRSPLSPLISGSLASCLWTPTARPALLWAAELSGPDMVLYPCSRPGPGAPQASVPRGPTGAVGAKHHKGGVDLAGLPGVPPKHHPPPPDCRVGRTGASHAICWACSPSSLMPGGSGSQALSHSGPPWGLLASSQYPMTQITLRVRQTLKESSLLTHEETEEQRRYGICLKPHSKLVAELGWFLCPRAAGRGSRPLQPVRLTCGR